MSLVLTTNTNDNSGAGAPNVGINRPFDYKNFTTDTIDLPANAEVAVQSIKFNKEGAIQVNATNSQFYVFLGDKTLDGDGEVADGDINNVTSMPVHTEIGRGRLSNMNQISIASFPSLISEAIEDGLNHPDMVPNGGTNTSGVETTVSRDSNGVFDGYDFKINYPTSASLVSASDVMTFENTFLGRNNFSGSFSGKTITKIRVNASITEELTGVGPPIDSPILYIKNIGGTAVPPIGDKAWFGLRLVSDKVPNDGDYYVVRSVAADGIVPAYLVLNRNLTLPTDAVDTDIVLTANCEMINTERPISQASGTFNVDFKESGVLFQCGLTRYLTEQATDYGEQNIPFFEEGRNVSFYDYVCKSVLDNATGKYYLRVYHSVCKEGQETEQLELREIDYTHVTPLIETHATSGSYNASTSPSRIFWNIQNERVELRVESENGTTKHTLFNGTNASKLRNLKPTSTLTKYLYAKVRVQSLGKSMTVLDFKGSKPTNFVYGQRREFNAFSGVQGYDYYCKAYWAGSGFGGGEGGAANVDLRAMFDYTGADKDTDYTQKGLTNNSLLNTSSTANYGAALILIDARVDNSVGFYPTTGANAVDLLGFGTSPIQVIPSASGALFETFVSSDIPTLMSSNSIFVRLNNYLQRTVNGQTNGISKILYHIPRFDNTGEEFGGLFFEPNERTYIKLNNTTPLKMNEWHLSLVNPDETLADTITGKTIIMLHFRKSMD